MPKTMTFADVGPLMISVHTDEDPDDATWDASLKAAQANMDRGTLKGLLVVTEGGGPNARQRKATREMFRGQSVATSVVSDALTVRGLVTAFGWFNPKIRSFPTANLKEALGYLGIEGFMAARLMLKVHEMRRELPPAKQTTTKQTATKTE